MPLYRSNCFFCDTTFEWQSPRMTTEDPPCPQCGGSTERGYWPVASVWVKPLVQYGDRGKETFAKDEKAGGHWTFSKSSDEALEKGRPIPRFIRTAQDQAQYCREEKLINPKELPSNLTVASDGQHYETANRSEI